MDSQDVSQEEILHGQLPKPPERAVHIRLTRQTFFSGLVVLMAVVVTVQFFQFRSLAQQYGDRFKESGVPTTATSASAASQTPSPTQQSSSSLQNLPSQVGGC